MCTALAVLVFGLSAKAAPVYKRELTAVEAAPTAELSLVK